MVAWRPSVVELMRAPLVIVLDEQSITLAVCGVAWEACYDASLGTTRHNPQGPRVDHLPRHCPIRAGLVLAASLAGSISLAGYPQSRPRHLHGEFVAGGAVYARPRRLVCLVPCACRALGRRAPARAPNVLSLGQGLPHR